MRQPRRARCQRSPSGCAGLSTSVADIDRLVAAIAEIASGAPAPVTYVQDVHTGDFWPEGGAPGWADEDWAMGASCARG